MKKFTCEAFIIHSFKYKETSCILDVFTQQHGRISILARGLRRSISRYKGLALPFQHVELTCGGKGSLKTLYSLEWIGGYRHLRNLSIFFGFYINELIYNLLPKEDSYNTLFNHYLDTVRKLSTELNLISTTRIFEKNLLKELGYGLILKKEGNSNLNIESENTYYYLPEVGPVRKKTKYTSDAIKGSTLLNLYEEKFPNIAMYKETYILMRHVFSFYLGEKKMRTPEIISNLREL